MTAPPPTSCASRAARASPPGRIRPGDKPALAGFFRLPQRGVAPRRYLAPKPKLRTRDLAFFTEVDHDRHVAFVALDREGAIVGVARYAAWPDRGDRAELAFAVVDEWHGRGLGSALAERLVDHARRAGLTALTASTLSENAAAHALLRRLGSARLSLVRRRRVRARVRRRPGPGRRLIASRPQHRRVPPGRGPVHADRR